MISLLIKVPISFEFGCLSQQSIFLCLSECHIIEYSLALFIASGYLDRHCTGMVIQLELCRIELLLRHMLNYYNKIMQIRMRKVIVLLLMVIRCFGNEKLVCYSKSKLQSEAIYQFFTGVRNGYFVDVYPEAPIIDSSTVYLQSKAWSGLNILADNQTLANFKYSRIYDSNIQAKLTPQQPGGAEMPSLDQLRLTYSQLCDKHIRKQINFLIVPQSHLQMLLDSTMVDASNLQSVCRPDVLLVKQYGNDKMNEAQRKQFERKGYQQTNSYENFVFLFKNEKIQTYQQRAKKNKEQQSTHASSLVSFSSIVQGLASKVLNKAVSMNEIKSQLIDNQMYIHFSRVGAIFDISQLRDSSNLPMHLLLMETNQKFSMLKVPKQHIEQEDLNLGDNLAFKHITYSPPNEKVKHLYVFQHDFDQSTQKQNETIILSDGVKPFSSKEVKQYKIDEVQKWNQPNPSKGTPEQKLPGTTTDSQKQKEVSQLTQEKQRLRREKQKLQQQLDRKSKQILDRQKSILQKQASLKKREYEHKLKQEQAARKKKQSKQTATLTPSQSNSTKSGPAGTHEQIASKESNPTISAIHTKQSISNLTPESALNKDNILENPAMLIVILISSIVGAAMLAALVTACVMRRNRRANVLRKIKNNSNLHSEHEQGTEQEEGHEKAVGSEIDDIVIKQ